MSKGDILTNSSVLGVKCDGIHFNPKIEVLLKCLAIILKIHVYKF